jgi:FkbM family methyltransferase
VYKTLENLCPAHTDARPLVSVIIPAYKSAAYISDALHSVFSQTYQNIEVILINDGSPDTEEFERKIEPYRSRIVYIKQENGGPSAARNAGILRAQGEYLAFLDSDDAWYPECIAAQVALALGEQPCRDLVYANILWYSQSIRDGIPYFEKCPSNGALTFESLLIQDCQAPTSCTMVRRQAAIEAGLFDERFVRAEDYDLWLRIAHRKARMAYQPTVLGRHRVLPGSLSSNNIKALEGMVEVLRKLDKLLDLSAREGSLLQKKLEYTEALLELERGKERLLEGDFNGASVSLRKARTFFRSAKLRWSLVGLRLAPRLTRAFVRMWLMPRRPPQNPPLLQGIAPMLSAVTVQLSLPIKNVVGTIRRSIKRLAETAQRRTTASRTTHPLALHCTIASNDYGSYCVPQASGDRPAAQAILCGKAWEPETIAFMRDNCGNGDIVHAGTYFGDFLPGLSSAMSDGALIWAFEPNKENYQCARITVELNALNDRIKLAHAALGDTDGIVMISVLDGAGRPLGGASHVSTTGKERVAQIALDGLIPDRRRVSILQLDVEGCEEQALHGGEKLVRRDRPILILETVPTSEWFNNLLEDCGYVLERCLEENSAFVAPVS